MRMTQPMSCSCTAPHDDDDYDDADADDDDDDDGVVCDDDGQGDEYDENGYDFGNHYDADADGIRCGTIPAMSTIEGSLRRRKRNSSRRLSESQHECYTRHDSHEYYTQPTRMLYTANTHAAPSQHECRFVNGGGGGVGVGCVG